MIITLAGVASTGAATATAQAASPRSARTGCPPITSSPVAGRVQVTGSRVLSAVQPVLAGQCGGTTSRRSDTAVGSPPLIYHGGRVMGVPEFGNTVVVTPIFWEPAGATQYAFTDSYKSLITQYLGDVAAASGRHDNVFATNTEYHGNNGSVHYRIALGGAIDDTNALPTTSGCEVSAGPIYADGSGYDFCLTDHQIVAELRSVTAGMDHDLGHMYVLFTPKHVESCFGAPGSRQCTLHPQNPNRSRVPEYCAYHSSYGPGFNSIYAEMPFPIHDSGDTVGSTCGSEWNFGATQSPNGDADADAEISPLSHEISEAMTDPDGGGWYDRNGFENGDECAYVYGRTRGPAGARYNQMINGDDYLTQEEFSNADYKATGRGCVPALTPTITSITANAGRTDGRNRITITGLDLAAAGSVTFDGEAARSFTALNGRRLTVVTPAHAAGRVGVVVSTPDGTTNAGHFTYVARPTVSGISPKSGLRAGGTLVTVTGRNFVRGAAVLFGKKPAATVRYVSPTTLRARAPRHQRGAFDIRVRDAGGTSTPRQRARFTVR